MNIFTSPFKRRELYWKIRGWFFPQQKWLFKKIGNTWIDIDGIIEIVLFECIIRYVEVERGLDGSWEKAKEVKEELSKIYGYVKNERPTLQKRLNLAYPTSEGELWNSQGVFKSCEELYGKSFEEAYRDVHRIENLLTAMDTWAMMKIVEHREYLWT